jgi:hypothetical protein
MTWNVCPTCGSRKGWGHLQCRSCDYVSRRAVEAATFERRFWDRVVAADCWIWAGGLTTAGYGRASVPGKGRQAAHRIAYELLVGPIPEGLTLDHLCRNRACVNPDHLEPVGMTENMRRGAARGMALYRPPTHCRRGHPFEGGNTYISASGRSCRTCVLAAGRVRKAAIRLARMVSIAVPEPDLMGWRG